LKCLREKIECLRQKMHVIALKKGIEHPEVLKISRQLDKAINEFYKDDQIQEVG